MLHCDGTRNELSNDRRRSAASASFRIRIAVSGTAAVCFECRLQPEWKRVSKDCYYSLLNYLLCLFSSSPVFPITSTLSPSPNPAFANDKGCLLKAPADIITDRMQKAITIFIRLIRHFTRGQRHRRLVPPRQRRFDQALVGAQGAALRKRFEPVCTGTATSIWRHTDLRAPSPSMRLTHST